MQITVALDGSKRRDLTLYAGDEVALGLSVYAGELDETPLDSALVTNVRMLFGSRSSIPIANGEAFTVSARASDRTRYRLVGEVDGRAQTLAEGLVRVIGGDCCLRWYCGDSPLASQIGNWLLLENGNWLATETGNAFLMEP